MIMSLSVQKTDGHISPQYFFRTTLKFFEIGNKQFSLSIKHVKCWNRSSESNMISKLCCQIPTRKNLLVVFYSFWINLADEFFWNINKQTNAQGEFPSYQPHAELQPNSVSSCIWPQTLFNCTRTYLPVC